MIHRHIFKYNISMNALSEEQTVVLNCIKSGHNSVVDAVAGSGKSTTVLSIATKLISKKFIQFTYNSMLRCEIKEKTEQLAISNLDIHTYHSLAVKYYNSSAYTDTGIRHILANNIVPRIHIPKKDVIVIDEAQDMTFLYFQFIVKYTMDMNHPFQLIVLGDYMQGLYEFKGADTRFLTLAIEIWKNHPNIKSKIFNSCTLKTSYRITNQMASFINTVMLDEERLVACREGPVKVVYIRNSQRNIENTVIFYIKSLLASGAKPSDIFILGASVKGPNSAVRKMENVLVSGGIPCHVPMFESDNVDEKIIQKKLVFSTFHSVKGRQRKYVFVLGFDQGYMRFYCRNLPQDQCPSTLYVACTRALDGLVLLERSDFENDRPLEFLKKSQFEIKKLNYMDFKGTPYYPLFQPVDDAVDELVLKHFVTPTDLIKFIPESVLESITPILESMFIVEREKGVELDIPTVIETVDGFYEEISDLNGLAIPAMYYDFLNAKWSSDSVTNVLYETVLLILDEMKDYEHKFLKEVASKMPTTFTKPADYLFLANVYTAFQEKLYFKLKQISPEDYNWLTDAMMSQCKKRLDKFVGSECETAKPLIEKTLIHQSQEVDHENIDLFLGEYFEYNIKFRFTARLDIVTPQTVWEIKCVREITMDHQLQLVIYAWLYEMCRVTSKDQDHVPHNFKIFNIRTGEIQKLVANREQLDFIVISLLQGKYQEVEKITDEQFCDLCANYLRDKCSLTTSKNPIALTSIANNSSYAPSLNTGCL
jgi:hypothetical protein